MVAAGGVHEQHIRLTAERAHGGLEDWAFAQRKQPRLVCGTSLADGNGTRDDVPAPNQRRSCPARVAGGPTTRLSAWEADEAARRGKRLGAWRPQRGRSARQGLLLENEFVSGLWPLAHRRILNRVRHATPAELAEVVRAKGVRDARVLEAFEHVARAGFVPSELAADAYLDRPLPIPHEQVTTQPSLVSFILDELGVWF
jgi:hypothetical protein